MATKLEIKSEDKMTSLKDYQREPYKEISTKNIIPKGNDLIIVNPIDPKRVSMDKKSLNGKSIAKAIGVFLFTLGGYFLVKKTNVFSYFRKTNKKPNSNISDSEIMEVKNTISPQKTLKTFGQTNSPIINPVTEINRDTDRTVKFEEIKVEEIKNFSEINEEKMEMKKFFSRRSINVKNPIPDQNAKIGQQFNVTIDGTDFFNSSTGTLFLEAINISPWLTSNLNPIFKNLYYTHFDVQGVVVSGDYAYLASEDSNLQIIDISDLSKPISVASYGSTFGYAEGIAISGNYAYLADGYLGLQIINITNPSNPIFMGSYNTLDNARKVTIFGNYAYLITNSGLRIIDITNPSNLTLTGSYDMLNYPSKVVISGNYAYIADGSIALQIIDISNPTSPFLESSCDIEGWTHGMAVFGNYAYAVNVNSGLQIIDISNPSNPTFKGSYYIPDLCKGITVSKNYAYVANTESILHVIDIKDPANPLFKGSCNIWGNAN
jgi:hypothetical protein